MKSKEVIEYDEFTKKLLKGLDLSYQRLIEYKRKNNGELVIMKDGNDSLRSNLKVSNEPLL